MKKAFGALTLLGLVWMGAGLPARNENREAPDAIMALITRVENQAWNPGRVDALDELYNPDCALHVPPLPDFKGVEGLKTIIAMFHKDISDCRFQIDEIFEAGDRVTERYSWQGTHQKSGKKVRVTGCVIYRLRNGKVSEAWNFEDMLGLYQQLGLVSAPSGETGR